jgi:hypothetical protein
MNNEIEQVRSSVIQLKIGNRTYNMVENRQCKVCMHPGRFQVEAKILLNYGWTAISRFVQDLQHEKIDGSIEEWYPLTPIQIKNHFERGHCPDGSVSKALVEERAKKRGIDLEDATTGFVDHIIVQNAVLARGYELLVEGKIEPDTKDLLLASKLLADSEQANTESSTIEQWQEFMGVYFSAVQNVVSREQWDEIVLEIKKHPVFSDMNPTRTNDNVDIQDAEVID